MTVTTQHPTRLREATASIPDAAVAGYPSLRTAARLVGVSASTLSRRSEVAWVQAGQEKRIPAGEVVRLAALYRRRRLSRVAGELVERAAPQGPEVQEAVGEEVDVALERYSAPRIPQDAEAFLAEAHRRLPKVLAAQVEETLRRAPA